MATGASLGHGSYAEVVEVKYNKVTFAAKKYHMQEMKELLPAFGREIHIYTQIRHPNIVSYYGLCKLQDSDARVIVMEKMVTTLDKFLKLPNIVLTLKFKRIHDILEGLNHLHTRTPAIIHRDLTATNILLDSKRVAKIGDFGNSRVMPPSPELMTSRPGTQDYMPPEAQEQGQEYDMKIDMFSFGHLALYVVIQKRPKVLAAKYKPSHSTKRIARTEIERRQKAIHEMEEVLSGGNKHPLHSVIVECLDDEPEERPLCLDILNRLVTVF